MRCSLESETVFLMTQTPPKQRSFKVKFFETLDDGEVRFDFAYFQQVFFLQIVALLLLFSPLIGRRLHPAIPAGTPWGMAALQTLMPWALLAGWTAVFYIVAAFFEWVFHRYLFHIIPNSLARKHTLHHYIHPIDNYHTHEEEQTESAHFPAHALVAFLIVFSLATWPLQHWLPHQPILLAVNIAVCVGYYRYELTHAQKHYSLTWQVQQLNNPRTGRKYEERFVLHFIHHDKDQYNMAIFAEDIKSFPDRLLGTFLQGRLLRDEQDHVVVKHEDGIPYFTIVLPEALPKPIGPVRLFDRLSLRWQKAFFRMYPHKRSHYHF